MSVRRADSSRRAVRTRRIDAETIKRLTADDTPPGERVRVLRRARGLTQDELARATGVSRSAVAQWETGRAGYGNKLSLLAQVLDVPVGHLKVEPDEPGRARTIRRMSNEEAMLIRHFRELGASERACMLMLARKLAAAPDA